MLLKAVPKCLLNTDRLGASIRSLGTLFQRLTVLSVKKCFLMSSLNLPWGSSEPFPHVLALDPREKTSAPPSPHPLLRKPQRAMRSHLNLLFSTLEKPRVLSHPSQDMPSRSSNSFVALLWTHLRTFTSLFVNQAT